MTLRTPYDGQPFYCAKCGAGFYEMMACEEPDCEREDVRDAERRRDRAKADAYADEKRRFVEQHGDLKR